MKPPLIIGICFLSIVVTACDGSVSAAKSSSQQADTPRVEAPLSVPVADGFDFPVGPPNAKGYYNAQPFTRNNHLGDDWNGTGGGNSDKGDPVFVVALGVVKDARDFGGGWGKVVRVLHNAGSESKPMYVESLYAHLDTILVAQGGLVSRGQQLGTIGDAGGAYWAHLHFEIRTDTSLGLGGGYSPDTSGYTDPSIFIRSNRPKR